MLAESAKINKIPPSFKKKFKGKYNKLQTKI